MRTRSTSNRATAAAGSIEWLTTKGRGGEPRLRTLGWNRLASIYHSRRATADVCRAIEREVRRCGYCPRNILTIHGR